MRGRPPFNRAIVTSARPDEVKAALAIQRAIDNGTIKDAPVASETMTEFIRRQRELAPQHAALLEQIMETGLRPNEVEAMIFSDYCWFVTKAQSADNEWDRQQWAKLANKALNSLAVLTRGKIANKRNPKAITMRINGNGVLEHDDAGDEIPTD